jgi:hypothetical protein
MPSRDTQSTGRASQFKLRSLLPRESVETSTASGHKEDPLGTSGKEVGSQAQIDRLKDEVRTLTAQVRLLTQQLSRKSTSEQPIRHPYFLPELAEGSRRQSNQSPSPATTVPAIPPHELAELRADAAQVSELRAQLTTANERIRRLNERCSTSVPRSELAQAQASRDLAREELQRLMAEHGALQGLCKDTQKALLSRQNAVPTSYP